MPVRRADYPAQAGLRRMWAFIMILAE